MSNTGDAQGKSRCNGAPSGHRKCAYTVLCVTLICRMMQSVELGFSSPSEFSFASILEPSTHSLCSIALLDSRRHCACHCLCMCLLRTEFAASISGLLCCRLDSIGLLFRLIDLSRQQHQQSTAELIAATTHQKHCTIQTHRDSVESKPNNRPSIDQASSLEASIDRLSSRASLCIITRRCAESISHSSEAAHAASNASR